MNIPNNIRRKTSQEKIEKVFIELIQTKNINEITVTDICKKTNLNRSTFYANYLDIYDLAAKIRKKLELEVEKLYQIEKDTNYNSNNFLKLFKHIKENQLFYKTYFKLDTDNSFSPIKPNYKYDFKLATSLYNDKYIDYHIAFFYAGINAIIKKWLDNGCKESPEEIESILISEYKNKNI